MDVQGITVPEFLYGTAWKEERTEALVAAALANGFRGIDTANQRRHYHEAGAGAAIRKAVERGELQRDELFIQTKFTYAEGQDSRLPFDPAADYPTQVRQSLNSSLEHLGVERIDSLLLHGPRVRRGFSDVDFLVWKTMEEILADGGTRLIGVSNVTAEQLETLCSSATVKPAFVQNRCFARLGWDREVRDVCRVHGVVYQGFSLLTANVQEIEGPVIQELEAKYRRTPAQIIFRFAQQLGMIVLTGTTDEKHMREDLAVKEFELTLEEVKAIEEM